MTKDRFNWRLAAPMVLLGALSAVLLMLFLMAQAQRADFAAREREQALVDNGFRARIEAVARTVSSETVWDDAVLKLDHAFDQEWASDNIGAFLWETEGVGRSFVLDRADAPIFASRRGLDRPPNDYAAFSEGAASLIAIVRAAEIERGYPLRGREASLLSEPITASAVKNIGGEVYLLSAALVQPDFGMAMPLTDRAPVVVTAINLNDGFLTEFGDQFLLRDLHLHVGDASFEKAEAHLALLDESGALVGTLDWRPHKPGQAILQRALAPIMAVLLGLGGICYLLFKRMRRAAQGLVASEAHAKHIAMHDALTGLPNRLHLVDRLEHALRQRTRDNERVAVLIIDLDRFKEINDTLGHQCGDELIEEVARRFALRCRRADTLARVGGDEFAVVQCGATAASASALAHRLIAALTAPIDLGGGAMFIGCSIGVTLSEEDSDSAEMLRQGDLALHRAKERGRAQTCFFEPEMDAALRARRALESDLRDALASGALEMAYQPQVNSWGEVTGAEALVRWRHPERGQVSPAYFVPVAEDCGLIEALGRYTIKRVFEETKAWPKLRVGVNVSAYQLRQTDFVDEVRALILETGADPHRYELEITEGVLLGDDAGTHARLQQLRGLGFSLVLDDFGTGYSSLSYLRRYPVSKIKIDRSFVTNLGADDEAEAVVGAIVKLARALNLAVIAEGVETAAQRERLKQLGCTEVQGFLTGAPLPRAALAALLNKPAAA